VTLAAQKQVQRSTVIEWAALEAKPTQTGARRDVMRAPTPSLDDLEIHVTTLNVGQVSHPSHQHPEEEHVSYRPRSIGRAFPVRPAELGVYELSSAFARAIPWPTTFRQPLNACAARSSRAGTWANTSSLT
jgi:hypothetical protein